jgi:hypothetical protein
MTKFYWVLLSTAGVMLISIQPSLSELLTPKIMSMELAGVNLRMKRREAKSELSRRGFKKIEDEDKRTLSGCRFDRYREQTEAVEGRGVIILNYSSDNFVAYIKYYELLPKNDESFRRFLVKNLGEMKCVSRDELSNQYHWGDESNCDKDWYSVENEKKAKFPRLIFRHWLSQQYPSLAINSISISNLRTSGESYEGLSRFFKSFLCDRIYK